MACILDASPTGVNTSLYRKEFEFAVLWYHLNFIIINKLLFYDKYDLNIKVSPRDGRPELVYLVGISIRSGRGRYRDTQIVTLAPCYQLYNQSSWMLEVIITHKLYFKTGAIECSTRYHKPISLQLLPILEPNQRI